MFGYWGWGTSTKQLVESTDAVEKQRGFEPPVFVDIRIHRNSQAVGFKNDALKSVVGEDRYQWMSDLGNEAVLPGFTSNKRIQIRSPKAADELLAMAAQLAKDRRHVIYFCACPHPSRCHRYAVANLLLKAAERKRIGLEVIEWPGDVPIWTPLQLGIRDQTNTHAKRLSLGDVEPLWQFAGLPYGSTVCVTRGNAESVVAAVGPVRFAPSGWYLPILQDGSKKELPVSRRAIEKWRKAWGYNALHAVPQ